MMEAEFTDVLRRAVELSARRFPAMIEEPSREKRRYYKRHQRLRERSDFSSDLLKSLLSNWTRTFGAERANLARNEFNALDKTLRAEGAVVVNNENLHHLFADLSNFYDSEMGRVGSRSILHEYLNVLDSPMKHFGPFQSYVISPLIVALLAYRMGGAITIVDARAKNTGPMSVKAQDNMLHVDNTPFNDEYKLLVLWRKGSDQGPRGQNFTYLPGTHLGVRDITVSAIDGSFFSTENESVFGTSQSIEEALRYQMKISGMPTPEVAELSGSSRPFSVLFAAGSLIHHRYRTTYGDARSCFIIAFHRSADLKSEGASQSKKYAETLEEAVLGGCGVSERRFVELVTRRHADIAEHLLKQTNLSAPEVAKSRLDLPRMKSWIAAAAAAPEIEDMKKKDRRLRRIGSSTWLDSEVIVRMMMHDKHGPLDLILYEDSHEEVRKPARNWIREAKPEQLESWVKFYMRDRINVRPEWMIGQSRLRGLGLELFLATTRGGEKVYGAKRQCESGGSADSMTQLLQDLVESLSRTYSYQNFVSTSLFLFLVCHDLERCARIESGLATSMGLFQHYVSASYALQLILMNP